jgi:hypothetical protein
MFRGSGRDHQGNNVLCLHGHAWPPSGRRPLLRNEFVRQGQTRSSSYAFRMGTNFPPGELMRMLTSVLPKLGPPKTMAPAFITKLGCSKHGVGFREAATVFGDPLATTFPDTIRSRIMLFDQRRIGKRSLVSHGPHRERRHHPGDQCTTGYTSREKILFY